MSLQVWLPSISDFHNQGLSDTNPIFSLAKGTFVTGGILGNCLKTTYPSGTIDTNYAPDLNNKSYTLCGWFKFNKQEIATYLDTLTYTSTNKTASGNLFGNANYGGLGIVWNSNNMYSDGEFTTITVLGHIRSSNIGSNTISGGTMAFDTWTHICLVWDRNDTDLRLYINGTLKSHSAISGTATDLVTKNLYVNWKINYAGNNVTASIPFCTNDLRAYDHALSLKEIKELNKGLVCHYPLNNQYISNNLILNGYGYDGALGWDSSTNISTTEIPPNEPTIKASYYSNNTTTPYTPISRSYTYILSMYLKAIATSGKTYPSILPYDVDKKFIANQNISFGADYTATLVQPLKYGDTVIYASDLSNWSVAEDNYIYVAVFGYKDSTGYVYPDMTYTADSLQFGTSTDKSHIDKTNNTITLNAPYKGEDRPIGTAISQASAGATYYYPFGSIAVTTITDWTLKTTTLTLNATRMRYAKYIRFRAYNSAYYAGIKLVSTPEVTNAVYDSSGCGNDLIKSGDFNISMNTPRNQYCTMFYDSYLYKPNFSLRNAWTCSVWFYLVTDSQRGGIV